MFLNTIFFDLKSSGNENRRFLGEVSLGTFFKNVFENVFWGHFKGPFLGTFFENVFWIVFRHVIGIVLKNVFAGRPQETFQNTPGESN